MSNVSRFIVENTTAQIKFPVEELLTNYLHT